VTAKTRWIAADGAWETTLRGRLVLRDSRLNRGTAFTEEERRSLGLTGMLPPHVLTLEEQAQRAYAQFLAQATDLGRNVFLGLLRDRNEVLFYRLMGDHVAEMLPVVYTPTVGEAIQQYSHEYRRPRGVFLSVDRPGDIGASFENTGLAADEVDLIIATDSEAILGIGDWGVGGIDISLGKLAVYTAAGGIDPGRVIAVVLDVGTNRQSLLDDPLYLGNRHRRVPEEQYDEFIDAYVTTAARMFPRALLHWEDLGTSNARRTLERWRDRMLTFNDDIQGTGAVNLAAVLSALKVARSTLADQRVAVFGAGTAGIGIADQLRDAMVAAGMERAASTALFWCLGSHGLLVDGAPMRDFQREYARPVSEVTDWDRLEDGSIGLAEVVRRVRPTILIGTSGQPGAFDEEVVRAMADGTARPMIFPMSNPTSLSEARPRDLLQWTDGRALVTTGSPFDPVMWGKTVHVIGQANNALVFPGIGLGTIVSAATRVTDAMLSAAAEAVADQVDSSSPGAPLLPMVEQLRETSVAVAAAVARAAEADGVTAHPLPSDLESAVRAAMWEPVYRAVRAV
jgi:malate dehydrogenase (oxaloacetate-decarboxylating)